MLILLKTCLMTVHLLALNLATAGPLVSLWFWESRGANASVGSQPLASRLVRASLGALLLGIATGGVMYWLASESFIEAAHRLPARAYWFALSELVFSAICIACMALSLKHRPQRRWLAFCLAVLSATNLWYHFPPLMTVLARLAIEPRSSKVEVLQRHDLLTLMSSGEVLSLTLHFVFASLAGAAVYALWIARHERQTEGSVAGQRKSAWLGLGVTAVQLGVGAWVLASLSSTARDDLLGMNFWGSLSFAGGLLATFALLQHLATAALGGNAGEGEQRPVAGNRVAWLFLLVVLLMCGSLQAVRG